MKRTMTIKRGRGKGKGRGMRRTRKRQQRQRQRQRGGSQILSPAFYSNENNAHFSGIGFTDPTGAVTGCTGSETSAAALRGADIFTRIGGIKTPVSMKGGSSSKSKRRQHRQRGGDGGVGNTNGYSIGGVYLPPNISGLANNLHTSYDSCRA